MALPKRRLSHARKRMRSSQKALRSPSIVSCPNCKAPKLPHVVCAKCGHLGGEQVLEISEK
ncbi:MAG: 50S ribosomal protein L32 [Candidatus Coatesbacteria bacterium]|nr:50S ribosomal protein L32 [Candidatus Coatesbacteria bacterium]